MVCKLLRRQAHLIHSTELEITFSQRRDEGEDDGRLASVQPHCDTL